MAEKELHLEAGFKPDFRYEAIQFFFRKHWVHFSKITVMGLLIGVLILIILIGLYSLSTFFSFYAAKAFFVFTTLIASFLYITLFFLELISYFFDMTIVTDHRILMVRKTVFLKNDSGAVDLTKIQDLTAECRGILQNYLQYGTMLITLSSSTPPIVIEYVPRPHETLERSNRIKRENILKRQERKMQDKEASYLQDIHDLLRSPAS